MIFEAGLITDDGRGAGGPGAASHLAPGPFLTLSSTTAKLTVDNQFRSSDSSTNHAFRPSAVFTSGSSGPVSEQSAARADAAAPEAVSWPGG
jgi:hypothetical protein